MALTFVSILVEFPREEVFEGAEVLVQIDDVFDRVGLVGTGGHRFL